MTEQNITEEILINEAHWISITREVFFAWGNEVNSG